MIVIANVPIKVGVVLHFIKRITILILKKYHLLKKKQPGNLHVLKLLTFATLNQSKFM